MKGFKWPVAVEHTIAAPARATWDVISMPGNLELCHPYCASNPVEVWPGSASKDEIRYLSGRVYERQFRDWIDGTGYDLEVGERGGKKSYVTWRIRPTDDRNCTLRITVYPDVLQSVPVVIRWMPHLFWLRPGLRKYLESVVRGFEWYVNRGEPVPRDKFGKHPWFSAQDRSVPTSSATDRSS